MVRPHYKMASGQILPILLETEDGGSQLLTSYTILSLAHIEDSAGVPNDSLCAILVLLDDSSHGNVTGVDATDGRPLKSIQTIGDVGKQIIILIHHVIQLTIIQGYPRSAVIFLNNDNVACP